MSHELPLVIFTIAATMSAGSFIVLGLIQVLGSGVPQKVMDRVTDPALYAIGPLLVVGFAASTFHLGSPMRAINSMRHFPTSALSVEIVTGVAFLVLGALFAALQWFKWGGHRLRQALAIITAAVGAYLVWAISRVYSLATVPAWATFHTPLRFYITALLLGGLAVGAAIIVGAYLRARRGAAGEEQEETLIRRTIQGIALGSILLMGLKYVAQPAYIGFLGAHEDPAAREALHLLTETYGFWSGAQNILVFLAVALMSYLLFRFAGGVGKRLMSVVALSAFVLALVGEFIGRQLFYAVLIRSGL